MNGPTQSSRSKFKHPFPAMPFVDKKRMIYLVDRFWFLNRTAVNKDTDKLANYLAKQLEAEIIEARSGEDVLTWKVPKNWYVREAQLKTKKGDIIVDFAQNPLHLWTHSIPFKGEITRDELMEHVWTDPERPDEFQYNYRNGYRYDSNDWGFSIPYNTVKELNDKSYLVHIDTDLDNNGSLKVINAYLKGRYADTIFISAHTCHPALVSDGIANIAIAVELYHYLKSIDRKYSYRFIFGPEYFAAATYLDRADEESIRYLICGIYLDMLSNNEPIGLQTSMQGDTFIDKIATNVLKSHVVNHILKPYRELWGNDETFYNGPGFNIPTIGLGRGMHREYHYNTDNLENLSMYHMVEGAWIIKRIIDVINSKNT